MSQTGLVPALLDLPITMASDSLKGLELTIRPIRHRTNAAVEEEAKLVRMARIGSQEEVTFRLNGEPATHEAGRKALQAARTAVQRSEPGNASHTPSFEWRYKPRTNEVTCVTVTLEV